MPQKRILLVMILILIGATWFFLDNKQNSENIIGLNKTEILLYSNLDNDFLHALIKEYNNDENGNVAVKLLTVEEKENGIMPDIYLLEHTTLNTLKKEQRLYAVLSEAGDLLAPHFKDGHNQWFGVFYDPTMFLVNQKYAREVGQENISSWQDIAKLQNIRVAMENLSNSSGTRDFLAAFASVIGEEKTLDYFRGLNKQIPQYSRFPFTPIRLTAVGDADLAITRRSYVFKYLENTFPAYKVIPGEGTPVILYGVAIDSASKKHKAVQLFRDWLLSSSEPQKIALEQNTGYVFLLTDGLNINHSNEPEKLWLNTEYSFPAEQEALVDKWLQSARFAVK